MSRFGRQPAADILRRRQISRVTVAEELGIKYSILNNTLAGHQTPSQALREGLATMLELPVDELFTKEPLARRQGRRYRGGASVSEGDDTRIVRRPRRSSENSDSDSDSEDLDDSEDDSAENGAELADAGAGT
jgi:transcriptional regulator with XRE-family HTH domain